jgi:tetratricopeptide (TPR) repeat protein
MIERDDAGRSDARSTELIERLYVLWIVTTLLLVLLVVVLVFFGSGSLHRQAALLTAQAEQIHALRESVERLERDVARAAAAPKTPPPTRSAGAPRTASQPSAAAGGAPATRPAAAPATAPATAPSQDRVTAERPRPTATAPSRGDAGPTTVTPASQLAAAERELSAARAALADETLCSVLRRTDLSAADRIRAGRLCVTLERWDLLAQVLSELNSVSDELVPARDFLRSVQLIRDRREAEALAMLDFLVQSSPDDYELRLWRGAALAEARQWDAAREALLAVARSADRPEGWCFLGRLDAAMDRPEPAAANFNLALVHDDHYAPAWESAGVLALNRRDLPAAVQHLSKAVECNPRRAESWLLLATAHAKAARAPDAATALRRALALRPELLETARQIEAVSRLFDEASLQALLPGAAETGDQPPGEPRRPASAPTTTGAEVDE